MDRSKRRLLKTASLSLLGGSSLRCSPGMTKAGEPPEPDGIDGKYCNPGGRCLGKSYFDLIKWMATRETKPWPEKVEPQKPNFARRVFGSSMKATFMGHASVLVQTQGLNVLVDPVWAERAGPFDRFGPKRICPPPAALDELPPLDLILITHNHYDHLHPKTVAKLWELHGCRVVAPSGNGKTIRSANASVPVEEYGWEEGPQITDACRLTLQPAYHWSRRSAFDENEALWCAFVLSTPGGNVYLAGDTGYNEGRHVRKTREKFGPFRFAALPVGAYEPRWFMKEQHVNPLEAVRLFKLLGAGYALGIHLQTFFGLTDEGYEEPVEELAKALREESLAEDRFRVLLAGQDWEIPEAAT